MTKEEFVFSIGFQGEAAIVDGKARKEYKNLSTSELAEKGLFRAAFCSALFDNDESEMKSVLESYKNQSGAQMSSIDDMKKMLGLYAVPDGINKVTVIN
ncbi:MAG: hypothetical protein PQJ61_15185 [Spirochaetales bacterium]|uniref:Uncharacterized protein n=1 Tax=Candidatus Thalassospirochaeta sargassi TaxID=3119039 RepID=A0AAJ1MLN9_9SPIO|nr:hypothetical protein [Spirochaetales bacterium]